MTQWNDVRVTQTVSVTTTAIELDLLPELNYVLVQPIDGDIRFYWGASNTAKHRILQNERVLIPNRGGLYIEADTGTVEVVYSEMNEAYE